MEMVLKPNLFMYLFFVSHKKSWLFVHHFLNIKIKC